MNLISCNNNFKLKLKMNNTNISIFILFLKNYFNFLLYLIISNNILFNIKRNLNSKNSFNDKITIDNKKIYQ